MAFDMWRSFLGCLAYSGLHRNAGLVPNASMCEPVYFSRCECSTSISRVMRLFEWHFTLLAFVEVSIFLQF